MVYARNIQILLAFTGYQLCVRYCLLLIWVTQFYYSHFRDYKIRTQRGWIFVPGHKVSTIVRPGDFPRSQDSFWDTFFTWFIKIHGLCATPKYKYWNRLSSVQADSCVQSTCRHEHSTAQEKCWWVWMLSKLTEPANSSRKHCRRWDMSWTAIDKMSNGEKDRGLLPKEGLF